MHLPYLDRCDEITLDGKPKSPGVVRDTYSHAQKMRASMTYAFGRLCGIGPIPWHKSEITGEMVGNPSVSNIVSSFMVSLRRRKVRAGEVQTSACAITSVSTIGPEHLSVLLQLNLGTFKGDLEETA